LGKLKSLAKSTQLAERNLWVMTPFAIPMISGCGRLISWINERLLLWQIKRAMSGLGLQTPILWVTVVVANAVALRLRRELGCYLVYYCVDNITVFPGVDSAYLATLEEDLHRGADIAFFVNHALLVHYQGRNENTFYVGHGVDFEHFSRVHTDSLPVPGDMVSIVRASQGRIAGYMGEINGMDADLIAYLANENPSVSFVFIGTSYEDISVLQALPNVFFLGQKAYQDLPAYLSCFAVCCLYYKTNLEFNKYRNPKKLLEYLATGRPVVSVDIPEVSYFGGAIAIAKTFAEYGQLLRCALSEDSALKRSERVNFAASQTWEKIAASIVDRFPLRLFGTGTERPSENMHAPGLRRETVTRIGAP
jgi:glycosyltransferase involved in cell wall biosynthesis